MAFFSPLATCVQKKGVKLIAFAPVLVSTSTLTWYFPFPRLVKLKDSLSVSLERVGESRRKIRKVHTCTLVGHFSFFQLLNIILSAATAEICLIVDYSHGGKMTMSPSIKGFVQGSER